ncbi:Fis family transcriptional regulator [Pseudomonas sp. 18.1.10]|uniref:helix-turn-helix domain-containing protein n=1 Tax=Pseudomonas sp. 18.1.10 TaxID=2969302 RepID=UPI0021504C6E|nr:helix-turn-helix domain-containing protein [Pseudomonas sp. 18.1.10]MCR4537015.1 Fis family transcriptional regulator [Pseudomonas sp. 18.1.10]
MHNVNLRSSVVVALASYLEILDGEIPSDGIYKVFTGEVERELFRFVYQHCGENQTLATKVLGISRATFRKKMTEFGFI